MIRNQNCQHVSTKIFSAFRWVYLSISPFPLLLFFSQLFGRSPQITVLPFFFLGTVLITASWTGKSQFSFQSQRKAMPKKVQTTAQLHSSHMLAKYAQNSPRQASTIREL